MFKYRIVDGFLDNFNDFRAYCDQLEYKPLTNPLDGVEYQGINRQIPIGICSEIIYKAQKVLEQPIIDATLFMRLSVEGTEIPQQAHTDTVMGKYGLLLYLNRAEHCQGGTAFVRHKETGMDRQPQDEQELAFWDKEKNEYDHWEITNNIDMHENRAQFFDCGYMHRAELPSSFGDNAENARLILAGFFKVA